MKVILLGEVRGKGGEGDVVDVAQGYAVNYLFPKKLAVQATAGNMKQLEQRRRNIEKREQVRLGDAEAARAQLDGKQVKVDVKVGEEGQLFGSVTSTMVADAIKAQLGIEIDRKKIEIKTPIKTAGAHQVPVAFYRDIRAVVTVLAGIDEVKDEAEEEPEEGAEAEATEAAEAEQAE